MNKMPRFPLQTIILSGIAIFLIWHVISDSFAAYLAQVAPQAALWLNPEQPDALIDLADKALKAPNTAIAGPTAEPSEPLPAAGHASTDNGSRDLDSAFLAFEPVDQNQSINRPIAPDDAPTIGKWVEAALLKEPLSAHAMQILGQLAEAEGDDVVASKFLNQAGHLSFHESEAAWWLLRKSAQSRDEKSTIFYADILLRTHPELVTYVAPILAKITEENGPSGLLTAALALNPPWRGQFLASMPNGVTDARAPLALLLALRASTAPPSTAEVNDYIDFLIARKFYDLAYYTWLQFLPPAQLQHVGLLFNGSFDVAPSGVPFDWKITPGAGVTVDIVPRLDKDGGRALLVDFQYGRVDYHSVAELVMLAPGTYEMKGKYKGKIDGPRGLKWRIVCVEPTADNLGESPMIMGMAPEWMALSFTFVVPPNKGCRAQYVRLDLDARMASEQLVSGSLMFDDLQILRIPIPPA